EVVIVLEYEKNRLFWIEQPSGPNGENRRAGNVKCASNVTAAKREHVAHIHKNASLLLDRVFESLGRKAGNAWKTSKHFRSFRVYLLHQRIVPGHRWRGFNCKIAEAFCVSELQKIIEFSLVTDRAAQPRADVGAAGRAGAVIGINHHVVGEVQIEIVQRVELLFRELPGKFLA